MLRTILKRKLVGGSVFNLRAHSLQRVLPVLILCGTLFGACRQDMHNQPKYRPLRPVEQIGTINDGRSARPQVEGTVARDDLREDVEFYTGKIAGAQQKPSNEAAQTSVQSSATSGQSPSTPQGMQ